MAQVMEARLVTRTTFAAQPRMVSNLNEGPLKQVDRDLFRVSSNKEEIIQSPVPQIAKTDIVGENSNSFHSEWDEPTLIEFRVSDSQDGSREVGVAYL